MKRFIVKIYQLDGTFKKTITDDLILNEIAFGSQKNGGQGELDLLLNLDYNDTDFEKSDFIRVYLYDDNFTSGELIYTGIIEEINRNYKDNQNTIELVCRGLASLLTRVMYQDGSYTFTANDTASNIIIDVVTYFNTIYTGGWLNTTGIVSTIGNISIDFEYDTSFDAIQAVADVYGTFWLVLPDGTVVFNSTPDTHLLTAVKDVQNVDINDDGSDIINRAIVEHASGTVTRSDTVSIAANGLFEEKYNKTELDAATASDFGDEVLANNGTKNAVIIDVNSKYIFENIKAGDNIKVRNINYVISSVVEKIDYSVNSCKIYLDKYDSVGKVLIN